MSDPGLAMSRLGERWSKLLGQATPGFDVDRSRQRVVRQCRGLASKPHARASTWVLAAAIAVVFLGGAVQFYRVGSPKQVATIEPGAWIQTKGGETFPLEFSEGSRIDVLSASRVQVTSVDPRGARLVLLHGAISAQVVHRPDTAWSLAAGPFNIQVTGTRFRIDWQPVSQNFTVSVDDGSVQVTGPLLERGRWIGKGERCTVRVRESELEFKRTPALALNPWPLISSVDDLPGSPSPSAAARPAESHPSGFGRRGRAAPSASPETSDSALSESDWRELESRGHYPEALALAERMGLPQVYDQGTIEDLMTLARAARFGNRDDIALRALLRCRQRFSGDPRAATAAFLLGRAAAPAQAAEWFATYLREQPAGPLAREAAGRLVEAYARAGEAAAAKDAAVKYLASYPDGPHAAFARRIVREPPGP